MRFATTVVVCAGTAITALAAYGEEASGYPYAYSLYSKGDYGASAEVCSGVIEQAGGDPRCGALSVLAHYRAGERAKAEEALRKLQEAGTSGSVVTKLKELLAGDAQTATLKAEVLEALRAFDVPRAERAISASGLPDHRQRLASAWLQVYQGNFDGALLETTKMPDGPAKAAVQGQLAAARSRFERAACQVSNYVPAAACLVAPVAGESSGEQRILEFRRAVNELAATAPMSEVSRQALALHALSLEPYESFAKLSDAFTSAGFRVRLGVRVQLAARVRKVDGKKITTPARLSSYILELDGAARKLRILVWPNSGSTEGAMPVPEAQPAELDLTKALVLMQSTHVIGGSVVPHSEKTAIVSAMPGSFAARGDFPLTTDIGLLAGQVAAKQVNHNFGQYLAKVSNNPKLRTALVPVKASGGGWGSIVSGMAMAGAGGALGASMGGTAGLMVATSAAEVGSSLLVLGLEERAGAQKAQDVKKTWAEMISGTAFAVLELPLFAEVDGILAGPNPALPQ
ncbi:MAG: hypothetical protein IT168_04935 [Bryobacterales bacterium]|nr:hypothetical protein [Bryobacterales bacterium]